MAFNKALPLVINAVILTFAILLPLSVQSSGASLGYPTNMAGSRLTATSTAAARFGSEASSVPRVEDSARQVPTGPDPLHHNNNPVSP